jgi:hypothetical protein
VTTPETWRAHAYAIVGRTVVLEAYLDIALALVNGRDAQSVEHLATSVFPQLSLSRRVDLLAAVDADNEMIASTVRRLRMLIGLRNSLAHSYMVGEHDDESALFWGWNRGRSTKTFVYRSLPLVVEVTAMRVEGNLWRIGGAYADLEVWADFHGFNEGVQPSTEAP